MSKVYLVGAGPGDPDLLTVKAARILARADVVLYDRLVSEEILALVNPSAELVYLGKHEGQQQEVQDQIFRTLRCYRGRRKTIVRLKGGDPMVFGRGAEEWLFLAENGIDTEIVPGISSSVAVPALCGIPVTFRGVATSFAVITGHSKDGLNPDWARYAGIETLVILMGVKYRDKIAQALLESGRPSTQPVAFIERGSTPEERILIATLRDVATGLVAVESPAVFVVGDVVRVRGLILEALERSASLAAEAA
jgi:uroporphyrin-III C-methyltransferase